MAMALVPAVSRSPKKLEQVEPAVAGKRSLEQTNSCSVLLKKRWLPQQRQAFHTVVRRDAETKSDGTKKNG
jgi:hypothetical protein